MTRIIAGAAKGRRLRVPPGTRTRPTSDRAREALFSALAAEIGSWSGVRVADLYAGSGALGLEAQSRGADHVLLVESDPRTAATVRGNVAAVGLPGAVVVTRPVDAVVSRPPPGEPYDLILLDPPYATPGADITGVLESLVAQRWLADDSVVVVERDRRSRSPAWPEGLTPERERRYGETVLYYARHMAG